jgi:DNA-binding transcriptional ArsR family regulator
MTGRRPPRATPEAATAASFRDLRDPREMRALAHPTRLALLEVLTLHGPLTATQAGELIGESPSSCSFHLRSLAQHGFVEETGEGRGRQRPWRRVDVGTNMSGPPYDDPQTEIAARALSGMFLDRDLAQLRQARANEDQLDPEWGEQQRHVEALAWVTAEELAELNEVLSDLLFRYRDRLDDPSRRPVGARAVALLYFAYNAELTQPSSGSRPV